VSDAGEVRYDGPEPRTELHSGPPTVPRPAATVILLRGGEHALEVLLVQRNPDARFLGGTWVFPGGAVSTDEGDSEHGLRAAAIRELREETGVQLIEPIELVPFARWITPAEVRTRFDTWFFLATAPEGVEVEVDGAEVVAHRWCSPADALAAGAARELTLVFPTIKQLEQLAGFPTASGLLEYARAHAVTPIQPRVRTDGERARIVLPGEPGYD
jgi:8-oxo-dGTP pyrophosphatase MutT (NUDIX family)